MRRRIRAARPAGFASTSGLHSGPGASAAPIEAGAAADALDARARVHTELRPVVSRGQVSPLDPINTEGIGRPARARVSTPGRHGGLVPRDTDQFSGAHTEIARKAFPHIPAMQPFDAGRAGRWRRRPPDATDAHAQMCDGAEGA